MKKFGYMPVTGMYFSLLAQKIYQVNEVSEINLGDGRFLYRDAKKEKTFER
jgi:hypothetical protein